MEYRADALVRAARIKLVVMDVDGTLTDGRIYIGPDGEAMKEFSVKDGMGISMLHTAGVATAIITTIALMHNIQVVEVNCEQGTSYVLIRVLGNDFVYEIDNEE